MIRFLNYRSNGESFDSSSPADVFYLLEGPSLRLKGSSSFFFLLRWPLILKFESFMCYESIKFLENYNKPEFSCLIYTNLESSEINFPVWNY